MTKTAPVIDELIMRLRKGGMTQHAHTPGPWQFEGKAHVRYEAGFNITFPDGSGFFLPDFIGEANARLIAAAPEMLEALERIERALPALTYPAPNEKLREVYAAGVAMRSEKQEHTRCIPVRYEYKDYAGEWVKSDLETTVKMRLETGCLTRVTYEVVGLAE